MSTPFDADSATYLVKNIGVSTLKVGSGDLTNAPVLLHMARFRLPIILSTGMATLAEVERALGVIASGYLRELTAYPTIADFSDTLLDREAWVELHGKVTLLHCTTEYPAASHSINLRAMSTLRSAFGLPVGFSDQKHLSLDRSLPGPNHRASIEPNELAEMIAPIRDVELALGNGRKMPAAEEVASRPVARRSLVATKPVRSGERFSETRPRHGIPPVEYWAYLGK